MPFGASLQPGGGTRFRLWAPGVAQVDLELEGKAGRARLALDPAPDGWHEVTAEASPGTRYRFRVGESLAVPDPAARFAPQDVHGPSEVIDPRAYDWRDEGWRGRPWHEAVLYELHVGAFTPEGTFAAARARLPELAALGITAIELMPVADFPGARNWGYDGVLPFAPDASYGRPEDLKALVDDAHALGLMVLLDVVYNHFGPEGNYLHAYCPEFFNPAHHTPWGAAINFDGPDNATVRAYCIHNALYWIGEFRFDGLRLDAVHAIRDDSSPHIVESIAQALREGPGRERAVHLVLENEANQARYLARDAAGRVRCATAQWNDDVHHAWHVLLTGETDGYYADYAEAPLARLGRALAEGFVYQGEPSAFSGGRPRGEPSAGLPPQAFIHFTQTHDQVGNRAMGERLHAQSDPLLEPAALACLLLAPQPPMLFMGEEWAASTPFLFFCDFGPELAEAVTQGRRGEFGRFAAFADPQAQARIPDPNLAATFEASKLKREECQRATHRERLARVAALLALRAKEIVPRLAGMGGGGRFAVAGDVLHVHWTLGDASRLHLFANFGRTDAAPRPAPAGARLHLHAARDAGEGLALDAGGVACVLEPARG
ncbi:MAG TPA: malto-oligosyltrehalose trehalohydrolase [Burkholderiales bacterium]